MWHKLCFFRASVRNVRCWARFLCCCSAVSQPTNGHSKLVAAKGRCGISFVFLGRQYATFDLSKATQEQLINYNCFHEVLTLSPVDCFFKTCITASSKLLGSAAWAVALKSGRRPLPRPARALALAARALAGGLRLVTEGYRGKPPQPPTPGGVTSGSPRGHLPRTRTLVIYSVFCSWCSKTSCFTVFRGFRGSGILSWHYQKTTRFTWF